MFGMTKVGKNPQQTGAIPGVKPTAQQLAHEAVEEVVFAFHLWNSGRR